MTFTARPYQVEDLSVLIARPNTPLLHDPGGGKTPIAAMYSRYCVQHLGYKVVWTMPLSLFGKNRADILVFGGFKEEEVAIVQGSAAKRLKIMQDPKVKVFLMSGQGYSNEWRLLLNAQPTCRVSVHDEIHLYYSTHTSKRTQQWYEASKYMFSVIPMTGSILKGRLSSAYPILHNKFPLYYGTYENFMSVHAMYDLNGRIMGWRLHEKLKEILKAVSVRRSFKEIYGNENKVLQVHVVPFTQAKHKDAYNKWRSLGLLEREDDWLKSEGNGGLQAMRERQILAHPQSMGIDLDDIETEKDAELQTYIEDHLFTGERLAIFSVFVEEQRRICRIIEKLGGKVGLINGTVSGKQRVLIDEDFQAGRLQFVVASPATAGIGFNWHFLQTMIFATFEYQDDSFLQAYRRGIRGVRETPLRIVVMAYKNTIEERILTIVDRKSRDANMVDETKEAFTLSSGKHKTATATDHKEGDAFSMENFA